LKTFPALIQLSVLHHRKNIMKLLNWKSPLVIAAVLAATAMSASAATCAVPSAGYPTIQAAADDPTCSTINVAPGIYPENVSITRSLTLNGAQAGQPVAGRTSGGLNESTVVAANPTGSQPVFLIDAASVTIDGFTIKNSVAANAAIGILVSSNGNDAVIFNNIVDGISSADVGAAGVAHGVFLQSGPDNVNVSNNDIRNVTSTQSAEGILIGGSGANSSDNVFIKGNTFVTVTSTADGAYAVRVNNPAGAPNIQVLNSEISNLTGGNRVYAIGFETNAGSSQVLDNNFSNLNSGTGNVVAVWFDYPAFFQAGVAFNDFNLSVADYGIAVSAAVRAGADPNNPVGATCNWWGSPSGPGPVGSGTGARVTPLVLFAPWRIAPKPDRTCTGSNVPRTEAQCKNGGWITHVRPDGSAFKSQGDCLQFVNNGH
jgi:hypothetical protein